MHCSVKGAQILHFFANGDRRISILVALVDRTADGVHRTGGEVHRTSHVFFFKKYTISQSTFTDKLSLKLKM